MYLLKRCQETSSYAPCPHLHSTMYLLKPVGPDEVLHYLEFTFHYVSIKTKECSIMGYSLLTFTFHYVSIKTMALEYPDRVVQIYIPLCIY